MKRVLLAIVHLYQRFLSPLLVALFGPTCRFQPTCSAYAEACLRTHGPWRGSLLSANRLCRCHPFSKGGFDPPPPLPSPTTPSATEASAAPSSAHAPS